MAVKLVKKVNGRTIGQLFLSLFRGCDFFVTPSAKAADTQKKRRHHFFRWCLLGGTLKGGNPLNLSPINDGGEVTQIWDQIGHRRIPYLMP